MEDAMPVKVWSRGRKTAGAPTGKTDSCGMEGCTGTLIQVKWPKGRSTWPCTKGMRFSKAGKVAELL